MAFPISFFILLGVALAVSSMGFKNYVWFISLGYGFSIAAEGVAMRDHQAGAEIQIKT